MKRGKKYQDAVKKFDVTKKYSLEEAVKLLKEVAYAKFNESVDVDVRLGIDPRHADQQVRGVVVLPHGTGREKRVIVFVKGEKLREAEASGADAVGGDDLIEKVQKGWLDFDAAIATPDMMRDVAKLGKVLGPRGLMPNPKTGTVTFDIANAVKEIKAGKVEFKVDKTAIIHSSVGKISFNEQQLKENIGTYLDAILKAKPAAAKGQYIKNITISTTMSPGISVSYGM